jgi:hypothetical protein
LLGISLSELATEAGVPLSTVQKVLSPAGTTPGKLIADRLAAWLTRAAEIPKGATGRTAVSAGNGVAVVKIASRDTTPPPLPPSPPPSSSSSSNGRAALAPNRLSPRQRDTLAGFVALTEARELRRALGMSEELIGQAVAGCELPAEAIARIAAFLDGAG